MYKRFWLNKNRGRGFMEVSVEDTTKDRKHLNGSVTLGDCNRSITLDLDCNKATRNERIRKIRSMIAALQDVEKALAEYKFGKGSDNLFD